MLRTPRNSAESLKSDSHQWSTAYPADIIDERRDPCGFLPTASTPRIWPPVRCAVNGQNADPERPWPKIKTSKTVNGPLTRLVAGELRCAYGERPRNCRFRQERDEKYFAGQGDAELAAAGWVLIAKPDDA